MNELYSLYRSCFSGADIAAEDVFEDVLSENKQTNIITETDQSGRLIGAVITVEDVIAAIFVDKSSRGNGIGSKLLDKAEEHIRRQGHETAVLGGMVIYQGAPIMEDNIKFFEKRGYHGDEITANMAASLEDFDIDKLDIYPAPEYIRFRYEKPEEHEKLLKAIEAVEPNWVQYFSKPSPKSRMKTLIAEDIRNGAIAGFVTTEPNAATFEHDNLITGSMGCVGVVPEYRRLGIGLRMVADGMQKLKEQGDQAVELTYIVLTDWYSRLGLKICSRQWMANTNLRLK